MRLTLLPLAALSALSAAAPSTPLTSRDDSCPTGFGQCGVITFQSGTFAPFGMGTCIMLSDDIQDIYVGHCYCSLWETCTAHGATDSYVGGMKMCEKPKKPEEFGGKKVKFLSCGGLA